jgi:hypothetical protein
VDDVDLIARIAARAHRAHTTSLKLVGSISSSTTMVQRFIRAAAGAAINAGRNADWRL